MSEESQNETTSSSFLSGRLPIFLLIGLVVISLLAVCGLGYALFQSTGEAETDTETAEPTPFPSAGGSDTTGAAGGDAIVYGISDSSTVSVTLDMPLTLSVKGRDLAVQTVTVNADGTWSPPISGEDTVGWVYGSIVNYIMALTPTSPCYRQLE